MKQFYPFFLGIMLGISGTNLYKMYKYTHFQVPKYKVGDCLSNGLYVEKILEIRKRNVFDEALYVTQGFIGGKPVIPDTISTWQADERYTLVKDYMCQPRDVEQDEHNHE